MKNNGITLVSLVVTIIVLIILAGVSLNLILGKHGIITIAEKAKENIEIAQIEELTKLNELYAQMDTEGTLGELDYDAIAKLNHFKKAIADYIEEAGGVKPEYTANVEEFGESIKGIVKEVTKHATATESDITQGKTAWVNGNLITGTSGASSSSGKIVKLISNGSSSVIIENCDIYCGEFGQHMKATNGDIIQSHTSWGGAASCKTSKIDLRDYDYLFFNGNAWR